MKYCIKCKLKLIFSEFNKENRRKDGLRPWCKTCCKDWAISNKQRIDSNCKTWKLNNKDKVRATKKKWRLNNKETKAAYEKAYAKANPSKCSASRAKRRAAEIQRIPPWLTAEDYKKIQEIYAEAKALTATTGIPHEVDHIIPLRGISVSGLHVPSNLQILTKAANLSKSNKLIL